MKVDNWRLVLSSGGPDGADNWKKTKGNGRATYKAVAGAP